MLKKDLFQISNCLMEKMVLLFASCELEIAVPFQGLPVLVVCCSIGTYFLQSKHVRKASLELRLWVFSAVINEDMITAFPTAVYFQGSFKEEKMMGRVLKAVRKSEAGREDCYGKLIRRKFSCPCYILCDSFCLISSSFSTHVVQVRPYEQGGWLAGSWNPLYGYDWWWTRANFKRD